MKISFLCCSFQVGCDGVGDYVRRFASVLSDSGHDVQVLALADRFVHAPVKQADPSKGFEVVRIPVSAWFAGDVSVAEEAVARFRPDWLSLQMVCYGYGRSGLLIRCQAAFRRLSQFGRRHMMFHEIWIGEFEHYNLRQRALGSLQRLLLVQLTRSWDPEVVHTSNAVYRELLGRTGIRAMELPLPGNIPIADLHGTDARQRLLSKLGGYNEPEVPTLVAGIFGAVHPIWAHGGSLRKIADACRAAGKRLLVVHFGRAGPVGSEAWKGLARELSDRAEFAKLGELPADEVSRTLQGLDLGISTSPWRLSGKSGSVAAMLEHGVPTVATDMSCRLRRGQTPSPSDHPLLHKFGDEFAARLARSEICRRAPRAREDQYREFLRSLERRTTEAGTQERR